MTNSRIEQLETAKGLEEAFQAKNITTAKIKFKAIDLKKKYETQKELVFQPILEKEVKLAAYNEKKEKIKQEIKKYFIELDFPSDSVKWSKEYYKNLKDGDMPLSDEDMHLIVKWTYMLGGGHPMHQMLDTMDPVALPPEKWKTSEKAETYGWNFRNHILKQLDSNKDYDTFTVNYMVFKADYEAAELLKGEIANFINNQKTFLETYEKEGKILTKVMQDCDEREKAEQEAQATKLSPADKIRDIIKTFYDSIEKNEGYFISIKNNMAYIKHKERKKDIQELQELLKKAHDVATGNGHKLKGKFLAAVKICKESLASNKTSVEKEVDFCMSDATSEPWLQVTSRGWTEAMSTPWAEATSGECTEAMDASVVLVPCLFQDVSLNGNAPCYSE